MAYAAWSVVFGEQPSASKWNILGTNDASFNDGTGIASSAITAVKLGAHTGAGSLDVSTTGDKSVSTLTFTPRVVILFPNHTSSTSTGGISVGVMTSAFASSSAMAVNTGVGSARVSNQTVALRVVGAGGATEVNITYVSMNSNGFTVNVGTANANTPTVTWIAFA